MLVAGCALLLAGTGVGAAATGVISGSQIKNGTITGAKIKNGTITGAKIKNGTITGAKIGAHTITASKLAIGVLRTYRFELTQADEGFYFNDSHDSAYALVNGSGYSGTSNVSVSNPLAGVFCVAVTSVVASSSWAAVSPDYYTDDTGQFTSTQVELSSGAPGCPAGDFQVMTYSVSTVYAVSPTAGTEKAASAGETTALKKR
jgi:hypothetical protein